MIAKVFGYLQGVLLIVILVTLYFRVRRDRAENEAAIERLEKMTASTISRQHIAPRPQISSAFPSWSSDTPAHEILGVSASASEDEIEAAYKALLKKFHPDRFASEGEGHQKRAHHTVLLLQKARDALLASKR